MKLITLQQYLTYDTDCHFTTLVIIPYAGKDTERTYLPAVAVHHSGLDTSSSLGGHQPAEQPCRQARKAHHQGNEVILILPRATIRCAA